MRWSGIGGMLKPGQREQVALNFDSKPQRRQGAPALSRKGQAASKEAGGAAGELWGAEGDVCTDATATCPLGTVTNNATRPIACR